MRDKGGAANNLIWLTWCDEPMLAPSLASFFVSQTTLSYISHSEMQGKRAPNGDRWSDDIECVMHSEIAERICGRRPDSRVATATLNNAIVGMALVDFNFEAPSPYIVVNDLVVDESHRGSGIGAAMLDWITSESAQVGTKRIFLESGVENHDAHRFFERLGFTTCSIVMERPIDPVWSSKPYREAFLKLRGRELP